MRVGGPALLRGGRSAFILGFSKNIYPERWYRGAARGPADSCPWSLECPVVNFLGRGLTRSCSPPRAPPPIPPFS